MLTAKEVAELKDVEPHTVHYWAKNGLKFQWFGRQRMFNIVDVENFLMGWSRRYRNKK